MGRARWCTCNAATEEPLEELDGKSEVKSVAIHEDAKDEGQIVAGYENGTIKAWDCAAAQLQQFLVLTFSSLGLHHMPCSCISRAQE